ncbi:MAG TPA: sulfate ABC transporter ATP-binding protein, partial [Paracoccus sp. (in: a-proteobacteria)]|nr:sulfate ABC transporter ATP-binding protein [Paracoccus sp. (in: a-proteobacteria)]
QIHEHPASPFVARFMGATVELPVTLHAGRAEAPGLDASRLPRRALPDGPATLFLRPADITPIADPAGRWRVARCDSNGAILRIDLSDGTTTIPVDLPRRAPEARALTRGASVHLRPEAGALFTAPRGTLSEIPAAAPAAATEYPKEKAV